MLYSLSTMMGKISYPTAINLSIIIKGYNIIVYRVSFASVSNPH